MKQWLPFSKLSHNLLVFVPAFLCGAYFDLTEFRLGSAALAQSGPFLLFARLLGGLLFAGIVLMLLRAARDLKGLGRVSWKELLILFAVLNVLTAVYAATSATVYCWDNAGYWVVAQGLSEQWLGRSQIFEILKSTITMDYNYLLAFPISLVMRLFGPSRAVYLFCISNLYVFPGLWGLCALAKQCKRGGLLLAAFFPMFLYIGLVGFSGVASCSLAIWAYVIYRSDRPAVSRGIVSGALLVFTFLLRRYFFFFAVSFGLAAFLVKLLFERKKWSDFLALFGSCALCALYFTPNFLLEKVLGSNYGDLYSAYALGLSSDWKLLFRYYGLLFLLCLLVGVLWALRKLRSRTMVFALIQLCSCFAAFVSVQTHGQHHLLLYLPGLAVLTGSVLAALPLSGLRCRAAVAAAAALTFLWCLIPKEQPASVDAIDAGDMLLPSFVFYGPTRDDIDQLLALADYVDALSAREQKSAVVLASSLTLNSEILTNLRSSLNLPEPEQQTVIQYHGTVDKRDAFNWNTLAADYIILTDPIQTHLGEENQQVMVQFARDILTGTGPGTAYRLLPERFQLNDGVTVYIYERTRNLSAEEYRLIAQRLADLYPAYADKYTVPDWIG